MFKEKLINAFDCIKVSQTDKRKLVSYLEKISNNKRIKVSSGEIKW